MCAGAGAADASLPDSSAWQGNAQHCLPGRRVGVLSKFLAVLHINTGKGSHCIDDLLFASGSFLFAVLGCHEICACAGAAEVSLPASSALPGGMRRAESLVLDGPWTLHWTKLILWCASPLQSFTYHGILQEKLYVPVATVFWKQGVALDWACGSASREETRHSTQASATFLQR